MALLSAPAPCRAWAGVRIGHRRWLQPPAATPGPDAPPGGAAGGPNADVLARIKRAREYKQGSKATEPAPTAPPVSVHPPPPPPPSPAAQAGGSASTEQPAPAAPLSGPEAVLARIQKAREYKQQGSPSSPSGPEPEPAGGPAAAAGEAATFAAGRNPYAAGGSADAAAGWLASVVTKEQAELDPSLRMEEITMQREEEMKRRGAEVIVGRAILDRRARIEAPSPEEQQQLRQQQAAEEQVAAEQQLEEQAVAAQAGQPSALQQPAAAAAGVEEQVEQQGQQAKVHKPKVATWGIFPRPQNISQAYGGGRNLKPGQALESEEQAKAREERVTAALKSYRKSLGMDVDPADEARAAALCEEGAELFKQGAISAALTKYEAAAALVPARSKWGGEANLNWALCLDSMGRNQEAYEIYKRVKNHPTAAVAKQASRMLFGFKAAENLKTASISYAPTSQAWKGYFDRISKGSWNSTYYTSSSSSSLDGEGPEVSEKVAALVAAGVMLGPLGLVAYRILLARQ